MARFDVESFRDLMLDMLQNNLGAELSAIEAEKGDGIALPNPAPAQYIHNLNDRVMTYESFIYYAVTSVDTPASGGQGYIQEITMSFAYLFTDTAQGDGVAEKKIFRYTRAMADVIKTQANKQRGRLGDLSVQTFAPFDLETNNNSGWLKAGVIEVTGAIAQ